MKREIPDGSYAHAPPVTIYTEALKTKAVMMSASTGPNPFSKTSGFTQPVQYSRAVKNYEGNVDFEAEKSTTKLNGFTSELNKKKVVQKETDTDRFIKVKKEIIELCKKRSANGIRGLAVMFKGMDRDRNKSIDPTEFKYAMRDYGAAFGNRRGRRIGNGPHIARHGAVTSIRRRRRDRAA